MLIDSAAPRSSSKPCNVRMVDLVMAVMKSEKQEAVALNSVVGFEEFVSLW